MAYLLYLVIVIVTIKLAFDFVANTARIANSLEDIAKAMHHDKPAKHKEMEKE